MNNEKNARIKLEAELDELNKINQKLRSTKLEQEDTINRMSNEIEITKTRLNTEVKEKQQLSSRLDSINESYKSVLSEFREKEDD